MVISTLGNTTTTYYPGKHYTKEVTSAGEKNDTLCAYGGNNTLPQV